MLLHQDRKYGFREWEHNLDIARLGYWQLANFVTVYGGGGAIPKSRVQLGDDLRHAQQQQIRVRTNCVGLGRVLQFV